MTLLRALLLMLALALAAPAGAQGFVAVPDTPAPVTDRAGMLNPAQRGALESVLREYQARTGSEIAILLVPSTAPEAIEQYGIRVAEKWKIGRKGIDDGAILIVARDNPKSLRRLRIEAGRGVQGVLTDAQSKRILEDVIAPHFRQNDFYGGLAAGVSAITTLLDKEHFAPPAQRGQQAQHAQQGNADSGIGWLPMLIVFFVVMSMLRSGRRRRALSSGGWGDAAGVILGSMIGNRIGSGGGGFGSGGGGGFGSGGTFDGGGASGDW